MSKRNMKINEKIKKTWSDTRREMQASYIFPKIPTAAFPTTARLTRELFQCNDERNKKK